ncbi:hypothetical protein ACFL0V_05465 [Nanoarchaeota archaeon]
MRETFNKVAVRFQTRYKEVIGIGVFFVLVSAYLYEFHYSLSSDDVMGLIAASSLFFGTILIGQGIRGWRDAAQWSSKFVTMRTKKGVHLDIKKRGKKKW